MNQDNTSSPSGFIIFNGEKFEIKRNGDSLDFKNLFIRDLSRIQGLGTLTDLRILDIGGIGISEIKCLDDLASLEWLNLSGNFISRIKGLNHLTNLKTLILDSNSIINLDGLDTLANLRGLH